VEAACVGGMFAAMAAATGGAEELTEARGKLRAAEEELERVNTGGDAQLIAEAKLGVAKVELGVAKAELGVAKAELGVAEAKWQAAPPEDKAVLQGSVLTAQKSVESAQHTVNSANMAYQNALRAAAPPHGEPAPRSKSNAKHGHSRCAVALCLLQVVCLDSAVCGCGKEGKKCCGSLQLALHPCISFWAEAHPAPDCDQLCHAFRERAWT